MMISLEKISIVLCTYNRSEMLHDALQSLVDQQTENEFCYEIVVVDDGSTDNTRVVVEQIETTSNVTVRSFEETGKGVAAARNRGIRESFGEWIAFFDDDEIADPHWLRELVKCAAQSGTKCVGGSVILRPSQPEPFPLPLVCRGILGERLLSRKPVKCPRNFFPGTGNILISRTVFDIVGHFNESLTTGGEDIEFGSRVRKAGFVAWYTPEAVVSHMIPAYRLQEDYLLWTSLRNGDNFAHRDYEEWGLAKVLLVCIARIGQALLVNAPFFGLAYLLRNDPVALGRKCLLWRCAGYVCRTLFIIGPRLFSRERLTRRLEFRAERKSSGKIISPSQGTRE